MTKKTEQKLKDGWRVMDHSETSKPSTSDLIELIQKTRKKQRFESFLFTLVALLIVIAVLLTLAKTPFLFIFFHGTAAVIAPIGLFIYFQWHKRGRINE
ncbi:putative membrane channel-forming protein YqfA (hemolysin III family) [Alkalihalobacillus xiaoxiensis]|uniref:Membrane channel-forming protein YqfA (Hemolysin III family) n=1 Tax=Shouchella xiaoxiensis TaxID=766895 RepID=A0ABS2SPE5_9BACI|nr:YxlC family protein [Shouchella xiaoxiensis]MBM7837397.1 putative membrane channel-forming protein YqfA (hemolysin III family) [Shouchella xiaoxiensis]